jgi:hypothetical protein
MKTKLTTLIILSLCFVSIWTIHSCKKEKNAKGIDKELFEMAENTNGFVWYKHSDEFLNKSSGSGHPQPFLKTRYNSIAAANLDSTGKIKTTSGFPEGSLIVKELHDQSKSLERYAILYKQTGHSDADTKGWVWGYINSDGKVAEAASNKGNACINCHSQADNIDYMLMNKYFP